MNLYLYFLILLVFSPKSYAYIDPGSGMILLQAFIAILGGAIAFIRKPKEIIINWFNKIRGKKDSNESQQTSIESAKNTGIEDNSD